MQNMCVSRIFGPTSDDSFRRISEAFAKRPPMIHDDGHTVGYMTHLERTRYGGVLVFADVLDEHVEMIREHQDKMVEPCQI